MFLRTVTIAGAMLAGTCGALADDDWAGLYQAVDIVDGSIDTMSVMPNADGTYDIRMTSSGLGVCGDDFGPGTIRSTGHVEDGNLVRKDVVFRCIETGETGAMSDAAYVPHEDLDVLTIEGVGGRINHYHKID